MKKVFIIGAGPAGITAGVELTKNSKEYDVTILEKSESIGGISKTVNVNSNRMDLGGHRFFSKDPRVIRWWEELMESQGSPSYDDKVLNRPVALKPHGPDPEKTDRVMLKRTRISRIYYNKKFFDYPVKLNAKTLKNMGFLTTIEVGLSYIASLFKKRPETCLENFYINRFGKKLYSMFFEGYTEKLWGRHPRDISADWGAQRVKGLSVIAVIKDVFSKLLPNKKNRKVETSLIEQFSYPKLGPGQLWEIGAEKFVAQSGTLLKGAKVVKIEKGDGKITKITYERHGERFTKTCDILLSSMPLSELIEISTDTPSEVKSVASNLPYREFVTLGLLVDKIKLKNLTKHKTLSNIVPDCWIYVQDTGVKLGRIQIFNNWSCYMVEKPEESVWMGLEYFCNEGDELWNMSEDEWRDFAVEELKKMSVIDDKTKILDCHLEKVEKAYPAYFDSYENIDTVINYLKGFENLYCIGRNGQHRYNNMDHSMACAFEAVDNIIKGKTDKDNVWQVNTEKEYHEEKE